MATAKRRMVLSHHIAYIPLLVIGNLTWFYFLDRWSRNFWSMWTICNRCYCKYC